MDAESEAWRRLGYLCVTMQTLKNHLTPTPVRWDTGVAEKIRRKDAG